MNRLKSVAIIALAALSFTACETEALDDHTKDIRGEYKPIFSYTLNGKNYVTDEVIVNWVSTQAFEINSKVSKVYKVGDSVSKYEVIEFNLRYSALAVGNYPWNGTLPPSEYSSAATLRYRDSAVIYSSGNTPDAILSGIGNANITKINSESEYLHGDFEYTLYPQERYQEEISPIRISGGKFYYVPYK